MFYKAIGFVTWKLATAYLRRRMGSYVRVVAVAGVASVLIGGYLAARNNSD